MPAGPCQFAAPGPGQLPVACILPCRLQAGGSTSPHLQDLLPCLPGAHGAFCFAAAPCKPDSHQAVSRDALNSKVLLNLDHVASLTLPAVCWLQAVSEAVEDVKSSLPHLAAGTALHLEPESIYALVPQNWLQVSLQVLPDGLGSQGNVLFNTSPASN